MSLLRDMKLMSRDKSVYLRSADLKICKVSRSQNQYICFTVFESS